MNKDMTEEISENSDLNRYELDESPHYCALFSKIADLLETKETVNIAIDGNCGSGKSTLADIIASRYDCNIFRMDDFFLRPEQKTAERLAETGGNIDYERFVAEIADKLKTQNPIQEPFSYRKYDCKTLTLGNPINILPKRLNVIEGCYSLHPAIPDIYDLKIFLKIDPDTQSQRILARNGEFMHKRFQNEWIPMENEYFKVFDIERKCDLVYNNI